MTHRHGAASSSSPQKPDAAGMEEEEATLKSIILINKNGLKSDFKKTLISFKSFYIDKIKYL